MGTKESEGKTETAGSLLLSFLVSTSVPLAVPGYFQIEGVPRASMTRWLTVVGLQQNSVQEKLKNTKQLFAVMK